MFQNESDKKRADAAISRHVFQVSHAIIILGTKTEEKKINMAKIKVIVLCIVLHIVWSKVQQFLRAHL